jgi:hypothetical protein
MYMQGETADLVVLELHGLIESAVSPLGRPLHITRWQKLK